MNNTNYHYMLKGLTPARLRDLLVDRYDCCDYCVWDGLPEACERGGHHCKDGIMEWLQQEAEK